MEDRLERALSQRHGQELMEFLLNVMPSYNRITMANCDETREMLEDEFCEEFLEDGPPKKKRRRDRMSPYKCPECKGRDVCVDTELACLVCRQCGLQGHIGFEHSRQNHDGKDTHTPFKYKPVMYMMRLLNQMQLMLVPRMTKKVKESLLAVDMYLTERCIAVCDITPQLVFEALRALKFSSLYPHRWFVTRKLNPQYTPLSLSHELEEKVCAVYLAAYEQFLRQYVWVSTKKRKFPNYLLFLQLTLQYLGVPDVDRHFPPPPKTNRLSVRKKVCGLLQSIGTPLVGAGSLAAYPIVPLKPTCYVCMRVCECNKTN